MSQTLRLSSALVLTGRLLMGAEFSHRINLRFTRGSEKNSSSPNPGVRVSHSSGRAPYNYSARQWHAPLPPSYRPTSSSGSGTSVRNSLRITRLYGSHAPGGSQYPEKSVSVHQPACRLWIGPRQGGAPNIFSANCEAQSTSSPGAQCGRAVRLLG